ncbi:hypothetical protein LTR81_017918 [Elasticomyces elasticus]
MAQAALGASRTLPQHSTTWIDRRTNADMTSTDRENINGWFALPRELRDEIYFQALTVTAPVKITRKWSPGLKAKARGLPMASLLQVSHRFSDEYREIAKETATLIVNDHFDQCTVQQIPIQISKAVSQLTTLQVNLVLTPDLAFVDCSSIVLAKPCCIMLQEIVMHLRWLRGLQSNLPQLKAFSVNIHISAPAVARLRVVLSAHLAAITTLPGLDTVMVYSNPNLDKKDAQKWDYESVHKEAVLKWERANGKLEDSTEERNMVLLDC